MLIFRTMRTDNNVSSRLEDMTQELENPSS